MDTTHTSNLEIKFEVKMSLVMTIMCCIWKLGGTVSTIRVHHLSTHYCVKNQLIRLRTLGEEAFGVTLALSENCESILSQYDGDEWVA